MRCVTWSCDVNDLACESASDAMTAADRLLASVHSGDILLLHDGHSARTPAGTAVILEVLPRLLSALGACGLRPITLGAALAQSRAVPADASVAGARS